MRRRSAKGIDMHWLHRIADRARGFLVGKSGSIAVMLATFAAFSMIIAAAITPESYDLKPGDIAPENIPATKDVEDTVSTEARREREAASVDPIYTLNSTVDEAVNHSVEAGRDLLLEKREDILDRLGEQVPEGTAIADLLDIVYVTQLNEQIAPVNLSTAQWALLAGTDQYVLEQAFQRTLQALTFVQETGIKEGFEEDALLQFDQELRRSLAELSLNDGYAELCKAIVLPYFSANFIYDSERTLSLRAEARESVEPVIFKKGQTIVRGGDPVTETQIAVMDSLGLMEHDIDWLMYFGIALLCAILLIVLYRFIALIKPEMLYDMNMELLLSIIMVLALGTSALVARFLPSLAPISISVLLIILLINPNIGIVVNIMLSMLIGLLLASSGAATVTAYGLLLTSVVGSIAAMFILRKRQTRIQVMIAGGVMAVVNGLSIFALGFVNSSNIVETAWMAIFVALSGPLCSIICIGIQPVLETIFRVITPSKLVELANPNQNLLRRLLLEAPGTYHHSIIVANLAEAAAEAIGANALLVRVGAYYHDAGKLRRPEFFRENQLGANPHDHLDPALSLEIIVSHPEDGVQLALKEKMPQPIIDIIATHHGDTLAAFFYYKAIEKYGEDAVKEADYRYHQPKPRTKEEALVMMADTVEAACRAMKDPTREKQRELIHKLVWQKMEDGQFDHCDISLRDIGMVCDAFAQALSGIYHERVEYPDAPQQQPLAESIEDLIGNGVVVRGAQSLPDGHSSDGHSPDGHSPDDHAIAERVAEA